MYKLISPSNYLAEDILEVVCRNRGLNIQEIKNPSADSIIHYSCLLNIDRAVNVIAHFKELAKSTAIKVGFIADSDTDGYTSFTTAYRYFEKNIPDFELVYYIHDGKQHGITKEAREWALAEDLNILIVPDAGSNDFESHKILREAEIITLVIDHHEADGMSEDAIVVNSQLSPEYTNKQFSGVGITYKFLKALDDELGINDADNYLDLVALGNIADSMEMTQPETRYFTYLGIANLRNEVLKELIFQNIGSWDKVNPHSLAFNVIPKINGTIRAGSQQEKIDLLEAFLGHGLEELHENSRARTEANKIETFLKKACRQAKNAHKRQNDSKKAWIKKIKAKVEKENLNTGYVVPIVFTKKDKFDNNLTGVIAGDLTGFYSKPVIILTQIEGSQECVGSMRGYDPFTKNTQELFLRTNLFNWVKGHANAAGVSINLDNIPKLTQAIDPLLTFEVSEESPELIPVDFAMRANQVSRSVVETVQKNEFYWGKGIESPKFAVTELTASFKDVKISSGGMISIEVNGVKYVQFTADPEFYDYVETPNTLTLTVIGTMGVNEFMGRTSYQFIIKDFKIEDIQENTAQKPIFIF